MRTALAIAIAVMAVAPPAVGSEAGERADVPVLWRAPGCGHDRLGGVAISEGREVSASTKDAWLPSADYARAFARLSEAARERGGDAVVLRLHEATFFTRGKIRSRRPVFVRLKGAAIRLRDGGAGCEFDVVDPSAVQARALRGEPVEMVPEAAAPDASSS